MLVPIPLESVNRAKGDASDFTQVYKEYRKAPKVTQTRIYLETMEEIFEKISDFTIIDKDAKGLLPIYGQNNLSKNMTRQGL